MRARARQRAAKRVSGHLAEHRPESNYSNFPCKTQPYPTLGPRGPTIRFDDLPLNASIRSYVHDARARDNDKTYSYNRWVILRKSSVFRITFPIGKHNSYIHAPFGCTKVLPFNNNDVGTVEEYVRSSFSIT